MGMAILSRTFLFFFVLKELAETYPCVPDGIVIWKGKTGVPGEKLLGERQRTNHKLNSHTASTPGFEPGPHWWEASALTTAPPLLPTWSKGGKVRRETSNISYIINSNLKPEKK